VVPRIPAGRTCTSEEGRLITRIFMLSSSCELRPSPQAGWVESGLVIPACGETVRSRAVLSATIRERSRCHEAIHRTQFAR
jgi:hypothetical protein